MQVVPHQITRLKGVTPHDITICELNEMYYIDHNGNHYFIEDEFFLPLGKNSFDLMLIEEYNDSESGVAVVRGIK